MGKGHGGDKRELKFWNSHLGKWGDKPGVVRNLVFGGSYKETMLGKKSFWPGNVLLWEGIISEEQRRL